MPYGWPLEPFGRAHPVRGYFNDPRISDTSRAFHFGIDISAPDGTPVHAIEGGTVHFEGGRAVAVVAPRGRVLAYWHIVPVVRHRQEVRTHQLLGHIEPPWAHVHFAESFRRAYRNPLRPGGISPWVDPTSPRVAGIELVRAGTQQTLSPLDIHGDVDVIAEAWDRPPLPVAPPWHDLVVAPALLRWRVLKKRKVVRAWHTPVDFRKTMLPASLFDTVYAPGTRQNKPNKIGLYRFYIAHGWTTSLLHDGLHRLEVEASDAQGNRAVAGLPFTVRNRR
jgi:hypothetical protein